MKEHRLNEKQLTAYAGHLRAEERSAATMEKYMRDVRGFAGWLKGASVTKEAAAGWKNALLDQGLAPATVNAKLSAVNGLFRFLGWEECRVKFLKVQRRTFRDASRDLAQREYVQLMDTARRRGLEWLALVMETLCGAGIRVSEVKYITVEAAKAGQTNVALKGKIRTIILPGKLARKLLKFAKKQKNSSGEIFCAKDGRGLTRFQIWRAMKSLCTEAGVIPSKVFPHNLRHLFAITFYQATRDIVKLADVLGHSSINTTRIYLLSTGEEHVRQLDRMGLVS